MVACLEPPLCLTPFSNFWIPISDDTFIFDNLLTFNNFSYNIILVCSDTFFIRLCNFQGEEPSEVFFIEPNFMIIKILLINYITEQQKILLASSLCQSTSQCQSTISNSLEKKLRRFPEASFQPKKISYVEASNIAFIKHPNE